MILSFQTFTCNGVFASPIGFKFVTLSIPLNPLNWMEIHNPEYFQWPSEMIPALLDSRSLKNIFGVFWPSSPSVHRSAVDPGRWTLQQVHSQRSPESAESMCPVDLLVRSLWWTWSDHPEPAADLTHTIFAFYCYRSAYLITPPHTFFPKNVDR